MFACETFTFRKLKDFFSVIRCIHALTLKYFTNAAQPKADEKLVKKHLERLAITEKETEISSNVHCDMLIKRPPTKPFYI